MTYSKAWDIISKTTYQQAEIEGWLDEWEVASEHVRMADYDFQVGNIDSVTDYDT